MPDDKIPSPRKFSLPHDEWRPGQYETREWIVNNSSKFMIVSAPTGSGKSATGASLGLGDKIVRVATHTRALQVQYKDGYGFKELFGMGAYPCHLYEGLFDDYQLTADSCSYPRQMHKCPIVKEGRCDYYTQRDRVQGFNRQVLSYAYLLKARWAKFDKPANYLYLDEAHNLPDELMRHFSLNLSHNFVTETLGINPWPRALRYAKQEQKQKVLFAWIAESIRTLRGERVRYGDVPRTVQGAMRAALLDNWINQFKLILEYRDRPYYLWVREDDIDFKKTGGAILELIPLTPQGYLNAIFNPYNNGAIGKYILTSATIGNPDIFAELLGIDYWDYRDVPSQFPPGSMPVYWASDAPKMNHRATDGEIQKQAEIIYNLIKSVGSSASGLVLFASKRATFDMADRLARLGLGDRLYVTPNDGGGTEERIAAYNEYKRLVPNAVHLTWCMWEGYDGFDDQFSIIAKIPYPTLNAPTRAQIEVDPHYYSWRTAIMVEQGVGRIRRGDPSHYGEDADKLTAVVDANVLKLYDYYSDHFQKCLTAI